MVLGATFAYPTNSTQRDDGFVLLEVGNPEQLESKVTPAKLRLFGHCIIKDGSLEKAISLGGGLKEGGKEVVHDEDELTL